jgi:tetratricopeptide (TPR) repeat protein
MFNRLHPISPETGWIFARWLAACAWFVVASPQALPAPAAAATASTKTPPQVFEDRPEPLVQLHPRTEAEQDHLDAAALFATGRTLESRQEFAAALGDLVRAARLDPQSTAALREAVPLAYSLNRRDMALRYAVKLAQLDSSDATLLRRLGMYEAEEGDWKQAIEFLEKAYQMGRSGAGKPTVDQLQLEVELARLDVLTERYADAATLFDAVRPALEKPKDFGLDKEGLQSLIGEKGLIYELMGTTYLEVKRTEDAATAFTKLNDITKNPGELALNLARVDSAAHRPTDAMTHLESYFNTHPTELSLASLALLSSTLAELKQSDQLMSHLDALRKALGSSVALDFYQAEQLRTAGKLPEAAAYYEAVLKKKPAGEVYEALAEIYRRTNEIEPLLKLLGDLVARSSSLEAIEGEQKKILADEKLYTALLDHVRAHHAEAKEANYSPLLAAAVLAAGHKDDQRAGELFELAIKANPKQQAEVLLMWGLDLLTAEKYKEAATVFRRGSEQGELLDNKPVFEFYLAGALELAGQTDAALAAADKIIAGRKTPDSRFASRRAWILYHAKRYDAAYLAYQQLLAKYDDDYASSDNRDVMREARSILSNICVIRHKNAEAEEWLEQVLDETPDDVGAMNDLGYLWADEGTHLQRALAMVRKAVAAEPNNAAYRDSLGWALYRVGQRADAVAELKKAIAAEKDPEGTIYEHLGDVYADLNQSHDALEQWRHALDGYRKEQDAERIKLVQAKIEKLNSNTLKP